MKTRQLLLRAVLMLMAVAEWQASDAQTLVLHLADGTTVDIELNNKFRMANIGDLTVVTMPDGNTVQYERSDIRTITYKGGSARGDVNSDGSVDVADIASVIDIMAGNESAVGSYTQCPNSDHPHLINLGLPSGTKWACCNVGALLPEGSGDYYAWGEVKPKEEYTWANYLHADGSYDTCHDIGLNIAKTAYDAATVNVNTQWHIPTYDQALELLNNTTATWVTQNGMNGMKFTGKNGGTIFLPAAGNWAGGADVEGEGILGGYWTSQPDMNYSYRAYYLRLSNDYPFKVLSYQQLAYGLSVRAVAE